MCWAKRIDFFNYILLAEDLAAYQVLKAAGEPVFISYNQSFSFKVKSESKYGTYEFQMTMLYRLEFLLRILQVGFHFLSADMDSIWLSDPFKYTWRQKTITIQGQTHKGTKMSGGFVLVHATTLGRQFWKDIITCQMKNIERIKAEALAGKKRIITDLTEQECINDRLHKVRMKLLDPYRFPDGRSFFNQQLPQRRGTVPIVIHGNWLIGVNAKVQRFKSWGLLASVNRSCTSLRTDLPYHVSKKAAPFRLRIRVMTYNRFFSLKRLLTSLQNADYLGDSVALEISVDQPPTPVTPEEREEWEQVVEYLGNGNVDISNFR